MKILRKCDINLIVNNIEIEMKFSIIGSVEFQIQLSGIRTKNCMPFLVFNAFFYIPFDDSKKNNGIFFVIRNSEILFNFEIFN